MAARRRQSARKSTSAPTRRTAGRHQGGSARLATVRARAVRARAVRARAVRARAVGTPPPAAAATPPPSRAVLTARDVMRKDVITIDRAAPLSEVERILTENRISGAPVTDETGAIVGVISMRDLVARYVEDPDARPRRARGYFQLSAEELEDEDYELTELPEETEETAEDVMTAEVHAVPAEAPLADVARVMVARRIHRVLVESGGHFAGLVGTFEILDAIARTAGASAARGSPS